jgi:hypothetical protein
MILCVAVSTVTSATYAQDTANLETIPEAGITATMDLVIETTLFGTLNGSDTDSAAAIGASTTTLFYEPPYTDALVHTLWLDADPLAFRYSFLLGLVTIDIDVTDLRIEAEESFVGQVAPDGTAEFPEAPLRITATVRWVSTALGVDDTVYIDASEPNPVNARLTESAGVVTLDQIEFPVLVYEGDPETLPPAISALTATITVDSTDLVYRGPATPSIIGDGNADGVIDLSDYVLLSDCLAGPDVITPVPCSLFDFDADDDVDEWDFAEFQVAFEG